MTNIVLMKQWPVTKFSLNFDFQKNNSLNMRTILSKILQQGKISFYIKNSLNKFQKSDKPFIYGIF